MNDKKKSFIVYHDWYPLIETQTDETLGKLLRCMFEYNTTGQTNTTLPEGAFMAYKFIESTFKRDKEAYQEKCITNAKSIQKYWDKVKGDTKEHIQPNTNVYERIQPNTNATDNDSVTDNENENVSESDKERRHTLFYFVFSKAFKDAFGIEYKARETDYEAANSLAGNLRTFVYGNYFPYQYTYNYFIAAFKKANEWNRSKMCMEHFAKHFQELHALVFEEGKLAVDNPAKMHRYGNEEYLDETIRKQFPQYFPDPPAAAANTPAEPLPGGDG